MDDCLDLAEGSCLFFLFFSHLHSSFELFYCISAVFRLHLLSFWVPSPKLAVV
jgi:hypothetical protein